MITAADATSAEIRASRVGRWGRVGDSTGTAVTDWDGRAERDGSVPSPSRTLPTRSTAPAQTPTDRNSHSHHRGGRRRRQRLRLPLRPAKRVVRHNRYAVVGVVAVGCTRGRVSGCDPAADGRAPPACMASRSRGCRAGGRMVRSGAAARAAAGGISCGGPWRLGRRRASGGRGRGSPHRTGGLCPR